MKRASGTNRTLQSRAIYTLRGSQKEKREKGTESLFKELMAENFPTLAKEMDIKIQKPKRQRKKKEYKEFHTETYYNKMSKVTKRLLKVAREKRLVTYKGIPIRLSADFQHKPCMSEESRMTYSKCRMGKKNAIQEYYPRQNSP